MFLAMFKVASHLKSLFLIMVPFNDNSKPWFLKVPMLVKIDPAPDVLGNVNGKIWSLTCAL